MKNIYILPLILFIISCGENIIQEITRYDNGVRKTFIEYLDKDSKKEIILSRVHYNLGGDTIFCESRNELGKLDGIQKDSIWFHPNHNILNKYRKRYYQNDELIKEGYSINTTTQSKGYHWVVFKNNRPINGMYYMVNDLNEVVMTTEYREGMFHGKQTLYTGGKKSFTYWNKSVQSDTYPYEDFLNKKIK